MYRKTLDLFADLAASKAQAMRSNLAGFLIASAMAGAYVGIGILIGSDVEQTVIAPAEIIGGLRKFVSRSLILQPAIGIEGMFLALPLLLICEFAASLNHAVLRYNMRCIRALRFGRSRCALRFCGFGKREAGSEAFEILLLVRGKVGRHYYPKPLIRLIPPQRASLLWSGPSRPSLLRH